MRISDWSSDVCSSDLVADRRFQADRLLGDLHHLADLLKRHRQTLGQFLRRRFAADLVKDLAAGADQLVDRLDHVDRNADGSRLIGEGAGDRLPDPPGRVGAETVATALFEIVDRLYQVTISPLTTVQ